VLVQHLLGKIVCCNASIPAAAEGEDIDLFDFQEAEVVDTVLSVILQWLLAHVLCVVISSLTG
jgi:hypothetical protein